MQFLIRLIFGSPGPAPLVIGACLGPQPPPSLSPRRRPCPRALNPLRPHAGASPALAGSCHPATPRPFQPKTQARGRISSTRGPGVMPMGGSGAGDWRPAGRGAHVACRRRAMLAGRFFISAWKKPRRKRSGSALAHPPPGPFTCRPSFPSPSLLYLKMLSCVARHIRTYLPNMLLAPMPVARSHASNSGYAERVAKQQLVLGCAFYKQWLRSFSFRQMTLVRSFMACGRTT